MPPTDVSDGDAGLSVDFYMFLTPVTWSIMLILLSFAVVIDFNVSMDDVVNDAIIIDDAVVLPVVHMDIVVA